MKDVCVEGVLTQLLQVQKKNQYVHPGYMEQQSVLSREGQGNLELFAES